MPQININAIHNCINNAIRDITAYDAIDNYPCNLRLLSNQTLYNPLDGTYQYSWFLSLRPLHHDATDLPTDDPKCKQAEQADEQAGNKQGWAFNYLANAFAQIHNLEFKHEETYEHSIMLRGHCQTLMLVETDCSLIINLFQYDE